VAERSFNFELRSFFVISIEFFVIKTLNSDAHTHAHLEAYLSLAASCFLDARLFNPPAHPGNIQGTPRNIQGTIRERQVTFREHPGNAKEHSRNSHHNRVPRLRLREQRSYLYQGSNGYHRGSLFLRILLILCIISKQTTAFPGRCVCPYAMRVEAKALYRLINIDVH
jgi:hypothetical protein